MTSIRKVTRYGNTRWLWTQCAGNKVTRRYFKTSEAAKGYEAEAERGRKELGTAWVCMTTTTRTEIIAAAGRAKAGGFSVATAVDWYAAHIKGSVASPTLADAVQAFVDAKSKQGLRPRSLRYLRASADTFASSFPEATVREITPQQIREYLHARKLAPRSRLGELVNISTFFAWCLAQDWCGKNPASAVSKPIVERTQPKIFTPAAAQRIINAAVETDLGMLGYIALGLFAGLRPESEIGRLNRDDIDMTAGWVVVKPDAKTRRRRLVQIKDALRTCLTLWLPTGEKPLPINFRRRWERLRIAAGYRKGWPQDGMRHSFVSYLYPIAGEVETASQAGHSAQQLHSDYRGLATRGTAEQFWAIRPAAAAAEVSQIRGTKVNS